MSVIAETAPAIPAARPGSKLPTIALLTAGALLSLVPGVPGIILGIPALGLLVARLRFFAVFLDRTELFVRRIFGKH